MEALQEIQDAVGNLAGSVGGSVVGIGHRWAVGSGVVIEPGKILTNAHNVRGDEVSVTFGGERTVVARVAGVDPDGDLAVLEVDTGDAPVVPWNEDAGEAPGLGAPVFAMSNPGGRGLRVTVGLVSGTDRSFRGPRGRRITGTLEHTAPLLPGSSGGPVVDRDGRLIGINTNRLGEGFYLAIPADDSLRRKVDALGRGETPRRVTLGVGLAPAAVAAKLRRAVGLPETEGLLVREVADDSPAARAGLEQGDLIVGAQGRSIGTFDDLFDVLATVASGDVLVLDIVRGTDERSVEMTL